MKPGVSLQRTTVLPSRTSAEARSIASTASGRVAGAGHDLEQAHVARRVEEVGDHEVARRGRPVRPSSSCRERDRGGVRRHDRARAFAPARAVRRARAWRRRPRRSPRRSSRRRPPAPDRRSRPPGRIQPAGRRPRRAARASAWAAPRARPRRRRRGRASRPARRRLRGARRCPRPSCRRRSPPPARSRSHDRLEHGGDALAAADALGGQRVAAAFAAQQLRRLAGDARAGRAQRMAERDRAAVEVARAPGRCRARAGRRAPGTRTPRSARPRRGRRRRSRPARAPCAWPAPGRCP